MSKRLLVVAACVLAFLPVGAYAQGVSFGVKGGLTLGDIPNFRDELDEPGINTSLRPGFAAGGFLMIRLGGGFSIQPEVLYTQKGVKADIGDGTTSGDIRYSAEYLDIPVLARLTFGKGIRGYVFAGPSMDFKLSAKMKVGFLGETEEEDISDEIEDFEFAAVFGGGLEFGPLLLEARWSEGLTNLAKEGTDESDQPLDLKSRTYLFLLGFRF